MSLVSLYAAGNSGASPPAGGACSSYLLTAGETKIVLDCGPGSLPHLRTQLGVWDIDAIFTSHMHTDHWLDLLALNVALFTQDGGPAGSGKRIPVFLPPGGRKTLAAAFAGLATGVQGTNASRWEQVLDVTEYDPARHHRRIRSALRRPHEARDPRLRHARHGQRHHRRFHGRH